MTYMGIYFFINHVIHYRGYDVELLNYFMGFHIDMDRTKLQIFKDSIYSNLFCDDDMTEKIVNIFFEAQKIYFAFNRFIYLYKLKKTKTRPCLTDLYLTPLSQIPEKDKIQLLHGNMQYTFRLTDLTKAWTEQLTHSNDLFPRPQILKNPYTNIPFDNHHLYNIYFKLYFSGFQISFFIKEFFKLDFNLVFYKLKLNQILKEIAIDNYLETNDIDELYDDIKSMCEKLNELYKKKFRVNLISNDDQKKIIVNTFKPYLKIFYKYSYSRDLLLKRHCIKLLKEEIKNFFLLNPMFGRRLVFITSKNKNLQVETPINTLSGKAKKFLKDIRFRS